jgi:uncharacterized tellurite resistance protein B-like protein
MSYGYYQGQEVQALDYYKKLLETERDVTARQKIAELIEKLQKIVDKDHTSRSSSIEIVQNAVPA